MDNSPSLESHARRRGPTIVVRLGLLAVGVLMGLLIVQGIQHRRTDLVVVSTICLAAAVIGLWMSFQQRRYD